MADTSAIWRRESHLGTSSGPVRSVSGSSNRKTSAKMSGSSGRISVIAGTLLDGTLVARQSRRGPAGDGGLLGHGSQPGGAALVLFQAFEAGGAVEIADDAVPPGR